VTVSRQSVVLRIGDRVAPSFELVDLADG